MRRRAEQLPISNCQPAPAGLCVEANFAVDLLFQSLEERLKVDLAEMRKFAQTIDFRASELQQIAPFRIDHDDPLVTVQHQYAAWHGVQHLLQCCAHAVVLGQASGQVRVAL